MYKQSCFETPKFLNIPLTELTKDEWIPFFSNIRILGYHGYLNIMDTLKIWLLYKVAMAFWINIHGCQRYTRHGHLCTY